MPWDSYYDIMTRIERKQDLALRLLSAVLKLEVNFDMATQATLDRLTADVAANTSAATSAATALTGFVATVADLSTKLQAALDAAGIDDPAVLAAASAIEANNATLIAATPVVAAAVVENTPAEVPAETPPA